MRWNAWFQTNVFSISDFSAPLLTHPRSSQGSTWENLGADIKALSVKGEGTLCHCSLSIWCVCSWLPNQSSRTITDYDLHKASILISNLNVTAPLDWACCMSTAYLQVESTLRSSFIMFGSLLQMHFMKYLSLQKFIAAECEGSAEECFLCARGDLGLHSTKLWGPFPSRIWQPIIVV